MQFVYNFDQKKDTIAAIATPAGEGAIAVIRLSGENSISILDRIFTKTKAEMSSHQVYFGKILGQDQTLIDTVLAFIMKAPKSYTGEDCVEIHCHGGSLVTRKVFQRVLETGARAALPGEFTLRAFLNQKIDLAQAEAVQTLISAQNELALKAAKEQLEGGLSKTIKQLQQELIEPTAILEASVDFPEEGLEFKSQKEIAANLNCVLKKMQRIAASFEQGKKITTGIRLAIIGTPNVGKSSLMNALCQKEKAIVTGIAGTTRDILEESINLGPLTFHLMDTAGIRKTRQTVEKEGIKRSQKALKQADLSILVLDASRPLNTDDLTLIKNAEKQKTILIWNKTDLNPTPPKIGFAHELMLSLKEPMLAKEAPEFSQLIQILEKLAFDNKSASKAEAVLTNQRHQNALLDAIDNCQKALLGLEKEESAELVAADMRFALSSLGQIIGHNLSEDILGEIFSKFCVGK